MQSGWLRWVAMVAVTRLCDKKQQVALLFKGVTVWTYRAEEVVTQLKSGHKGRANNRDRHKAAQEYNCQNHLKTSN